MTEHPILMSAPMVLAYQRGMKTQTRRLVKPQPCEFVQAAPDRHPQKHPAPYIDSDCTERKTPENPRGMSTLWTWWTRDDRQGRTVGRCPYGVPGDRLWFKEALRSDPCHGGIAFATDGASADGKRGTWRWKRDRLPGMFMPRTLARYTPPVTGVRVERLQAITPEDVIAEGIALPEWTPDFRDAADGVMRGYYAALWDSLNGKRAPWSGNPWVWVIEFPRFVKYEPPALTHCGSFRTLVGATHDGCPPGWRKQGLC